jgi:hypothetical protein
LQAATGVTILTRKIQEEGMDSGDPLFGLGWRSSNHRPGGSSRIPHAEVDDSRNSNFDDGRRDDVKRCAFDSYEDKAGQSLEFSADNLMQNYLQQCLEYYETQERFRNQGTDDGSRTTNVKSLQLVKSSTQEALTMQEIKDRLKESPVESRNALSDAAVIETERQVIKSQCFARDVAKGRSRAQAILDRFQHQQRQLLHLDRGGSKGRVGSAEGPTDSTMLGGLKATVPTTTDGMRKAGEWGEESHLSVALFVEQREKGLQREARLKQEFLRKNLEYVARREQQRAQHLASEIATCQVQQAWIQNKYNQALQERQRLQRESCLLEKSSQAAIGSRERRGAERLKRKSYSGASSHGHPQPGSASALEVYLSGVPVDGTVNETFLRKLFEPYGAIRKVHFYRDKVDGQLKGDGLIVFQNDNDEASSSLLTTVCMEVRCSVELV